MVFSPREAGRLAQLVRAPALQAGGRRFESCTAHHPVANVFRSHSTIDWRALWFRLGLLFVLTQVSSAQQTAHVEGVVRDADGKSVAGVHVTLQVDDPPGHYEAQTRADGTFALSVAAGHYKLTVVKSGYDVIEDSFALAPGDTKHCELILRSSQTASFKLDDRPSFTVAGVTDSTGSGGHGSDTRIRTGEALARETANLPPPENKSSIPESSESGMSPPTSESDLRAALANGNLKPKEQAELHRLLGNIEEKQNDPLAAEREYERASTLDASEQNYFAWGAELLLHGAATPAAEVFGKGARLHPDSARMLAGLGAALYTSGSADEAARLLCEATDIDPANPSPYLFLGKMQEASSSALPCAEEKLARYAQDQQEQEKDQPNHAALADYYYGLAVWKGNRGSGNPGVLRLAKVLFIKACALDTKLDAAYVALGDLNLSRGDMQQAIAAYEKAIAANPRSVGAHYGLGLAYRRIGENEKAENEIAQYKQLDQADAAAVERERKEVRQFLFSLQDQPTGRKATQDSLPPITK
jgi:Flp pilus assembly protein TadD